MIVELYQIWVNVYIEVLARICVRWRSMDLVNEECGSADLLCSNRIRRTHNEVRA